MKVYILRLLRKLKLLRLLNITQTIELNHSKVIIPINAGIGFTNMGVSELWMLDILERLSLDRNKVFIDVGVNIGQTLIKVQTVYPNIPYVGFEPNPNCVQYIETLVEKNGWSDIDIIPSGIAENVGLGILEHYTDDSVDSSASIVENYRKESVVYKRDIVTILNVDSVQHIWMGKEVSAIKIDVEGSELGVLKSFIDLILKERPFVLIEILPVYDSQNKRRLINQLEIEKIFDDLDYNMNRIHKTNENRLDFLELIESIGIHDNMDWCDYIFVPREVKSIV